MAERKGTLVRWFVWLSGNTEKVETWLEAQAAAGWHLVKVDCGLLRFHFRRAEPQRVRYCIDYPAKVDDQYKLLYNDAGWEHVADAHGWHMWRAVYKGDRRPEAFNDLESLIERNSRLTLVLGLGLGAMVAGLAPIYTLKVVRDTAMGKVLIVLMVALLLVSVAAVGALYKQNQRLKARKP